MTESEPLSITSSLPGGWTPSIGSETRSLIGHLGLDDISRQTLVNETAELLSQCGDPGSPANSEIGLAFGYVQSGKTMSFTTLTAMAKDNGYRIVIVIAGISTNLVAQSFTRLETDLRVDTRDDLQWLSFKNPKAHDATIRSQIATALGEYNDQSFPEEERKTVLITVMKQKNHLPNLCELLERLDLTGSPTLIIDDEADQHSMNTRERRNARTGEREMSPIHRKIVRLRETIPHHTFIQYTATPQANLFTSIMNNLSPNFIQLLTPGPAYTGGRTFFQDQPLLTEIIDDIGEDANPNVPPDSLVSALQVFYLGVVKGMRLKDGKKRSMMIHPSQFTFTHVEYSRFVTNMKNHFISVLALPDGSPDKNDLLALFRAAYDDLSRTATDLPAFEELAGDRLRHAINATVIQSLNGRPGNSTIVEWRNSYSFILIGGQAMDRGFTVEGLTVTYMPRTVGGGNADTIQQRARFFGYKQSYLGYCRVYLDQDAREAYIDYVRHEEDMRRRLAQHKASGRSLNEWYREVFLPSDLNLARRSVFFNDFERSALGSDWEFMRMPHYNERTVQNNTEATQGFIQSTSFSDSERARRVEMPLAAFVDSYLNLLLFPSPVDGPKFSALVDLLCRHLEENPDETCTVFLMSDFDHRIRRTLTASNQINELFTGPNANYAGDRAMRGAGISFQIHVVDLLSSGTTSHSSVPTIAVDIPQELGTELIRWA